MPNSKHGLATGQLKSGRKQHAPRVLHSTVPHRYSWQRATQCIQRPRQSWVDPVLQNTVVALHRVLLLPRQLHPQSFNRSHFSFRRTYPNSRAQELRKQSCSVKRVGL